MLAAAGWRVQDYAALNLGAGRGVAVREFPLKTGFADYLLIVDRKAIGAVEAKAAGITLSGIEPQSEKYSVGLPDVPPAWRRPLPFLYESTGIETYFTNGLDPEPRSRRVFSFHRPETLAAWAAAPATLRARLRSMPPLITAGLWGAQIEAITNLETSLAGDRPRALIQMATGSGKTFTAVSALYRLVKHAGAARALFLVDRAVVTEDQIRTVIRTFRDRLFTEIFPGRREVPKTLIFAKDDDHAETIVRIVREEFGKGNDFAQKITYRVSGVKPDDLIATFRNSYNPRIAVTVDMIATGTDIKPLEILLFMRVVNSRGLFEQMLGRGTRVISATDLQAVTPDAAAKTHFVIVDAVGIVEHPKAETQTLDRRRSVSLEALMRSVSLGATDPDTLETLAGRLARLDRALTPEDRSAIIAAAGHAVRDLAGALLDAADPDRHREAACLETGLDEPEECRIAQAAALMAARAAAPFDHPDLRNILIAIQRLGEQTIDDVSMDRVKEAGFSYEATEHARAVVESFRRFIEEHHDEITALQIIFNQPYARRHLTYDEIKALALRLEQPPLGYTPEALWQAYAQLERDRVRGVGARRVLTDLVSLVRHAVRPDEELAPFPEIVRARYDAWLAAQESAGRGFSAEQRWWLDRVAGYIGVNLAISPADLNGGEFHARGGQLGAPSAFGGDLPALLDELNTVLAA